MSPTRRRESVKHLCRTFEVSERRACRAMAQPRSSQRYAPKANGFVAKVVKTMHELVRKFPRYGYRTITKLLRRMGYPVNPKRIYRLWRREGFKVPRKPRRRRFEGSSAGSIVRRPAQYRNDVWAWDFLFSRDEGGRLIKWLVLVDEYTRECLLLEPRRNLTAVELRDLLTQVISERGVPSTVRSDNGPEFIAGALKSFLKLVGSGSTFIEPGAPWENGFAESFNSRLREEFLNLYRIADLKEARAEARRWKEHYNFDRPHSSLGDRTPVEFAADLPGDPPLGAPPLPGHHQERSGLVMATLS